MSRQKVPDDKRQRTAQACDYCKRRKQKCDGGKPCSTCAKRSVSCAYTAGSTSRPAEDETGSSPAKRRHTEQSSANASPAATASASSSASVSASTRGAVAAVAAAASASASASGASSDQPASTKNKRDAKTRSSSRKKNAPFPLEASFLQTSPARHHNHHQQHHSLPPISALPASAASHDQALEDHTRTSTTSGQDEEAVLEHTTRLLKDQTGRLLYIGDSATLSYLHLLRRMTESISGPSDFTTDPSKGNIVENVVDLPPHIRPPSMLADRQTANVLVESFFTNTSGLVEIFDRHEFLSDLDACYDNPLSASNHVLCLLFLTFAIGLVMATPDPGTPEYDIIQRLDNQPFDQAELFFRSAKCLCDPMSGLEDADFWSIQALSLISIYMLAVSKRNAAFACHGMAVRSAIALGLHRKEAMANYKGSALNARRNIWKSLYVLDRFIAASLGRPSAINEDECTEAALEDAFMVHISPILDQKQGHHHQAEGSSPASSYNNPAFKPTETHMLGVNATVRSCRITGNILKKLYARRRVSIRATQDIVQQCGIWTKDLHECLRWHSWSSASWSRDAGLPKRPPRAESIAILHVNLVYCHSIILLTRPFFLFLVRTDRGASRVTPPLRIRTEKFSEVCVTASYHTITMIQNALDSNYLPRRNPFVMYFLFTAALLIMSNEFVALFHHPNYNTYAAQAISIMDYFSKTDPQGRRLLWILKELQKTIVTQAKHDVMPGGTMLQDGTTRPFHFQYPSYFIDESHDPISLFFARSTVKSSWYQSASEPNNTAETASRQASGNNDNSASDGPGAGHPPSSHAPPPSTPGDQLSPMLYQKQNTSQPTSATAYAQNNQPRSSYSSMPPAGTTSPLLQSVTAFQSHSHPPLHHPVSHSQVQTAASGYAGASPTMPPVLPPPFPVLSHGLSYSPGHGGGGPVGTGGSGGTASMNFGGGYGGPTGYAGVMSGSAPGNIPGYFHPVPDGKSGDGDGSDSIGTDPEGFDFEVLWNWPINAALPGTDAVPIVTSGGTMVGTTSLASAGVGGVVAEHGHYAPVPVPSAVHGVSNVVPAYLVGSERSSEGAIKAHGGGGGPSPSLMMGSSSSKQQGPVPSSPLPPMYSPYTIPMSASGSGMTTPHGGPLMVQPTNVPLYPTADFG